MSVSAFAKDAIIDGIKYSLNDETLKAEVIEKNANKYSGDIIIPGTVNYMGKTYSVTSIGVSAFSGCKGLTSVTIPNSVTSIATYAFSGCSGLTMVTIPSSVTWIGVSAFFGCKGLTSVTIPNSVTSIGTGAFGGCSVLESIIVEEGNTIYDSHENCNAIIETATNTLIAGCKNTFIPNSVTSIGEEAFAYCEGLTSVNIPNSVTSIGERAFSGCSGLESIIVKDGNTVFDSRNNCNAIIESGTNTLIAGCKNTAIPNSVASIGECAFFGSSGLTSIVIPNSITIIDEDAFYNCTGLTSVISLIEEPFEIDYMVFFNTYYNYNDNSMIGEFTKATLYIPAETKNKYQNTYAWNQFTNIVEGIENAVKSVETDAKAEETERYNVSGQRISSPQKGLNIVKMSDGTTRKVMCK